MPQAVLRFGIGGRSSLLSPAILLAAGGGLAATALVAVLADLIAGLFSEPAAGPVIRAFAPAILTAGLGGVLAAALRAGGALVLSATVGAALFAVSLVLTVAAFAARPDAVTAAAMYSVACMITLAATAALLAIQPAIPAAPAFRDLAGFGLITVVIHGANVLNIWADRLVIGVLSDAVAVGIYQVASQLAMVAVVLRASVVTVFEAKVPKPGRDGRSPDVTAHFVAAARILTHATGPGLIALAFTAGFWVEWLFGSAYSGATLPLVLLLVGQLLMTLTGPSVNALHLTGEERMALALTSGGVLLNIAGNCLLIPLVGVAGAALATLLANAATGLACLGRLMQRGQLRLTRAGFQDLAFGLLASLAAAGLLSQFAGAGTLARAIAIGLAAYAAYATTVAASCTVEDELFELLRRGRGGLRIRPAAASRAPTGEESGLWP